MPDLMIGARGASVADIQRFLNAQGFTDHNGRPLRVDGIMGPRTEHALAAFQAANGITPNGVVDRTTAAAMTGARRTEMSQRMPLPRAKPTGFSKPDMPVPRPRPGAGLATRGFQPEPPAEDVISLDTIPIETGPYGAASFVDRSVAPGIRQVRPPMRDPDSRLGHQGVSARSDFGPRYEQMYDANRMAIDRNLSMTPEGRGNIYRAQRPSRIRRGTDRSASPIPSSRDVSDDPWIADSHIRDYYPPELDPATSIHMRQPARRAAGGRLLHSDVPGRTDRLPMAVASDSYVIPADIVSALGQGNTMAGGVILDQIVSKAGGAAYAKGGKVGETRRDTPIVAAGGEYVVDPEVVTAMGNGDTRRGHDILDKMIRNVRRQTIRELKSLPGPAR